MFETENGYRYGFNGKENDNEVKGEGNQQDYGMRIYDPRLGRFLSEDPLTKDYPWYSPYQFAGNMPIWAIDLDGLEPYIPCFSCEIQLAQSSGKEKEYLDRKSKEGKSTLAVLTVATDLLVTKGWLTRTLLGSQVLGAFEHNRAATPEGRTAQDQRSKEALADAFITWGVGKLFGIGLNVTNNVAKYAANRFYFAKEYYKQAGFTEEEFVKHARGIDLTKKVYEQTYEKGTVLEQWSYIGKDGKPINGNYYTLPNTNPNTLGISLKDRVKTLVTLEEKTTFLQSTAGDIHKSGETLKGGGVQLFQTNVKATVTVAQTP